MARSDPMDKVRRIALIGNYPPRLCGIATFTADVREALAAAGGTVDVYAMNDTAGGHDYPAEVVAAIGQDDLLDYQAAARRINASGADVVLVQHEYGIFGGEAGSLLLKLLDRVNAPVVATLHTVLEHPAHDQRAALDALLRRSSQVIVMAEKGRAILETVYNVNADRIAVVPHGVPDRPLAPTAGMKAKFGFDGRTVLLTFGLLSPNKGIETIIRALPAISVDRPDILYVVLGATHPHLVAREGETYRDGLKALADELGVAGHVRFVDGFLAQDLLLDYLEAADIYVTPYLNEAQITSGTLSYAVALGKPVVSTPYWHAVELLGDGTGVLAPFGDSGAFAGAIIALLADPAALEAVRQRAWEVGRGMTWARLAERYLAILAAAVERQPVRLAPARTAHRIVAPDLAGVERLSDGCGMLQHSIFVVPDRDHGYCVDDNCRALMLMHRIQGADAARADELATTYASFVQYAWNGAAGRFRNFMAYGRTWLEEVGSEDSFGRSLWAIGETAAHARRPELRQWALHLFDQVAPHALPLRSPRTWAFALFGADAMLEEHPRHVLSLSIVRQLADRLQHALRSCESDDWRWFETSLSYDNARLPEALLRAGRRLQRQDLIDDGLRAFDWLDGLQTNPDGQFRAVGTESFGREKQLPLPWDQQPLEAWSQMEAALEAHRVSGDPRWMRSAQRAYDWYLGDNDIGVPIAAISNGGCFDGLMSDRANLNQGAESVLAFQFACCAAARLATLTGRATTTHPREAASG